MQVSGMDLHAAIRERDEKIAELEAQVAEALRAQRRLMHFATRSPSSKPKESPTASSSSYAWLTCAM